MIFPTLNGPEFNYDMTSTFNKPSSFKTLELDIKAYPVHCGIHFHEQNNILKKFSKYVVSAELFNFKSFQIFKRISSVTFAEQKYNRGF